MPRTIAFMDGFDHYVGGLEIGLKYPKAHTVNDWEYGDWEGFKGIGKGLFIASEGGLVLGTNAGMADSGVYFAQPFPPSSAKHHYGMAIGRDSGNPRHVLGCMATSGAKFDIILNYDGDFTVIDHNNNIRLITSVVHPPSGDWTGFGYLEVIVNPSATAGSIHLYWNGTLIGAATGLTGWIGSISRAFIGCTATTYNPDDSTPWGEGGRLGIDDLVVSSWATSDTPVPSGPCKVHTVMPTGPGAETGFTAHPPPNWDAVDDWDLQNDTAYIDTNTNTNDTYEFEDVASAGALLGVQLTMMAHRGTTGPTRLHAVQRTSGGAVASFQTNGNGSIATSYRMYSSMVNGTGGITMAELNARQFGPGSRS